MFWLALAAALTTTDPEIQMASSGDSPVGMQPVSSAESAAADHGDASGPRAGFWRRFGASIIDGIILFVVEIILRAALKGAGQGLSVIVSLAYFTLFVGASRGQTPGMSALGIRVISFDGSGSIGYGRAAIRWIGGLVSTIPIFLGFFWMLWDKEKQCWHDKFASDVVVPVSAYPIRS
jgi:uncharacterized RDD family membrane protein YckC